ncbi:ATP-binding protein [Chitinasiproducens palmae]|uniref:Protoporphyrin IX magnesium-chelatase n=1 Tax=Chitinasiproducens palmae TaxID=1770053 RepID=A0A1H2PRY1_9BURK|nr:AAA family ATPase [Chitinasiproducens palmae]SDV49698.1 protoporphyrin IX magnesium-chelatase [Chitinasiproducens palmae]
MSASMQAAPLPVFPFVGLVGQARLQLALILAAIDPGLGGVLISGPRGTAKSTAARALAELLPAGRFVTLPLGASEERLSGTLDLQAVLRDGEVRFAPGLLAAAHGGVLYVDEVNLLPDPLVDLLLDVAASGVNTVERDGVSHRHAARFVLIGTMNREEGELRPQLLDRFGLSVALENCWEPDQRRAIVAARLAFDAAPDAYRARHAAEQARLAATIVAASQAVSGFDFSDAVHRRVGELCIAAAVDGIRADLVMLRAARALAAFETAAALDVGHVERVAELVLAHRRHEGAPTSPTTASASQRTHGQPSRSSTDFPESGREAAPDAQGSPRADEVVPDAVTAQMARPMAGGGRAASLPGGDGSGKSHGQPGDAATEGHASGRGDEDWGYLAPTPIDAQALGVTGRQAAKKA